MRMNEIGQGHQRHEISPGLRNKLWTKWQFAHTPRGGFQGTQNGVEIAIPLSINPCNMKMPARRTLYVLLGTLAQYLSYVQRPLNCPSSERVDLSPSRRCPPLPKPCACSGMPFPSQIHNTMPTPSWQHHCSLYTMHGQPLTIFQRPTASDHRTHLQ